MAFRRKSFSSTNKVAKGLSEDKQKQNNSEVDSESVKKMSEEFLKETQEDHSASEDMTIEEQAEIESKLRASPSEKSNSSTEEEARLKDDMEESFSDLLQDENRPSSTIDDEADPNKKFSRELEALLDEDKQNTDSRSLTIDEKIKIQELIQEYDVEERIEEMKRMINNKNTTVEDIKEFMKENFDKDKDTHIHYKQDDVNRILNEKDDEDDYKSSYRPK